MAAVSTSFAGPHTAGTITLSAHSATTAYVVQVTSGSGRVARIPVTTDGSGAATVKFIPQWDDRGAYTVTVLPAATTQASTTSGTIT